MARNDGAATTAAEAARRTTRRATLRIAGPGRPNKPAAGKPLVSKPVVKTPVIKASVIKALVARNKPVPRAPRRSAVDRLDDPSRDLPLTERVVKVIERELNMIEKIVHCARLHTDQRTEAERRTRTLASLARTLTELKKARGDDTQRSDHDDDRPRDLDELRQRLSERLAAKIRGGLPVPAGGDEAGRDGLPE